MQRLALPPRFNWEEKVEQQGLVFHHSDQGEYWAEGSCYRFTAKQIDDLEAVTNELSQMCLDAVQHVIDKERYREFWIPESAVPLIERSWNEEAPSIYGRFDLAYDGRSPPRLLEYNADTPTMLLESSVIQWHWLEDLKGVFPNADQFNSLHEKLVAKWKDIKPYLLGEPLHFGHIHDPAAEDTMTITYLRDTAEEAGIRTTDILMQDIGWDSKARKFVDLDEKGIQSIFKLYPWEWLVHEEFGQHLLESQGQTQWIEPAWKMILSNKAILPLLWELNPGHKNLLEAYLDGPRGMVEYVKKPLLSREGANVSIVSCDGNVETGGEYGEEGHIYQQYARLPSFGDRRPIIGSWLIDHEAAGIGIREAKGLVTDNRSCFVPHYFE